MRRTRSKTNNDKEQELKTEFGDVKESLSLSDLDDSSDSSCDIQDSSEKKYSGRNNETIENPILCNPNEPTDDSNGTQVDLKEGCIQIEKKGRNSCNKYFDFSNVIKSQEMLIGLHEKHIGSIRKEQIDDNSESKPDLSSVEKESVACLNVSELLAIGECDQKEVEEKNLENETSMSNDIVPEKEIQIVVDIPIKPSHINKKKQNDLENFILQKLLSSRRETQTYIHRVHLLCLVAHGNYLNEVLNSQELLAAALSLIPSENFYPPKHANLDYLEKLVKWFSKKINLRENKDIKSNILESLIECFADKYAFSIKCLVCLFICVVRVLGLKCRLIMSLQPLPLKLPRNEIIEIKNELEIATKQKNTTALKKIMNQIEKDKTKTSLKNSTILKDLDFTIIKQSSSKVLGDNHNNPCQMEMTKLKTGKKRTSTKRDSANFPSSSSTKSDRNTNLDKQKTKSSERKVLSSDSENEKKKYENKRKKGNDVWAEVFLEAEEKWISVDIKEAKVHCDHQLYTSATQPVSYILGWNNDKTIKDLTQKYAPQWLTVTRKLRVDSKWWEEVLFKWKPKQTPQEKEEDRDLNRILQDKPLPSSISEYKNHPLYILKRHLLKFESIYPPDAPPLGFVRGEAVYSRLLVFKLHSREAWLKEAKLVRLNEKPYKIVKSRSKQTKFQNENNPTLELFGEWQVEDYIPPPAVDGKVPRNEYGNIDLYKPCMLPPGTVHLQVPGLNRIARKLDIDCVPAVTHWEFTGGGYHPVIDGYVVCQEFRDILMDAWHEDFQEVEKRSREKIENRIYGNWKKLIKGLLIREKLQKRYNFGEPTTSGTGVKKNKSLKRKYK